MSEQPNHDIRKYSNPFLANRFNSHNINLSHIIKYESGTSNICIILSRIKYPKFDVTGITRFKRILLGSDVSGVVS